MSSYEPKHCHTRLSPSHKQKAQDAQTLRHGPVRLSPQKKRTRYGGYPCHFSEVAKKRQLPKALNLQELSSISINPPLTKKEGDQGSWNAPAV